MSLKAELETWAAALKAYDEEQFEQALDLFSQIADSSKVLTNLGLIYATLGEHELAVEQFIAATGLDQYLAVAYFQCGVSNFLLGRYELSLKDFEEALIYLRGNQSINYEQLGLKFKLYSAEVLFNKGLSMIYMNQVDEGMQDLEEARRNKVTDEHNVIEDAIKDRGEGYTVFSIPVGIVYRPSESKLKNAKTKDYLGKAKLVATADANEAYTTFTGVTRLRQGMTNTGAPLDRPPSDPNPQSTFVPPPRENGRGPTRSNSASAASGGSLGRSNTQINVGPRRGSESAVGMGEGQGVGRSNTMRTMGGSGAANGMGGPTRGLSIRKPEPLGRSPTASSANGRSFGGGRNGGGGGGNGGDSSPGDERVPNPARLTEIYDDYIDGYADPDPSTMPPLPSAGAGGEGRVAAWAKQSAQPQPPRRSPSSSFGGSSGSMRRRLSRRPTNYSSRNGGGGGGGGMSPYAEDDEGFGSEDEWEMTKVKVKIHYRDDVRGMTIDPAATIDEFISKLSQKFNKNFSISNGGLKFKDEDGVQVSLRDESDWELAIETARDHAKGRPEGKLEIWAEDK
ncbi:hypothetical protein SISNIDRAFT_459314 [Sistotremastrum niveocremeum HHB9708]|uniref:PB1 domain-containing protein n=1 Tax=Sistotremastrum niveocremeum HHB9708 TaxID=1314777 RepID=A0A164PMT2_9AGAM|nr:hypothetical protein SISNIDRAFT_459314 [Sistotremastrum niveocremeum HHB9708]